MTAKRYHHRYTSRGHRRLGIPLVSIAANVDADILEAFAGAHERVTGSQLAQLAGRSYAQVPAVSCTVVAVPLRDLLTTFAACPGVPADPFDPAQFEVAISYG